MAQEDRGPRCMAGRHLTGFKKIVHDILMDNELENGYGAYKVSYAGANNPQKNQSGLSYGPNQRDMSKRLDAALDFMDILIKVTDKKGDLIFTLDEVNTICGGKDGNNIREPHKTAKQIFGKDLDRVNAALRSEYGIRKINELYLNDLNRETAQLDTFISKIRNPAAKLFYMSDYGKAYLYDFKNQFGLTTDWKEGKFLHDYLNGDLNGRIRIDYSTKQEYTASLIRYSIEDHVKFIRGTREWKEKTVPVEDRLKKTENVLVSKYELSDKNRYCKLVSFNYSADDLGLDDAVFDDSTSDEVGSFAIYEDVSHTWDNDTHVDYEPSMGFGPKPDVKVDPI